MIRAIQKIIRAFLWMYRALARIILCANHL